MSNGPRIPNFGTREGFIYVGEIDVALMAAIDAQAAREAEARDKRVTLHQGVIHEQNEKPCSPSPT